MNANVERGRRIVEAAEAFYEVGLRSGRPVEIDGDRCEGGLVIFTADCVIVGPDDYSDIRAFAAIDVSL